MIFSFPDIPSWMRSYGPFNRVAAGLFIDDSTVHWWSRTGQHSDGRLGDLIANDALITHTTKLLNLLRFGLS